MVVGGCSVNGPTVSGSLKSFLSTSYLVWFELPGSEMLSQDVLSLHEVSLKVERGSGGVIMPFSIYKMHSIGR